MPEPPLYSQSMADNHQPTLPEDLLHALSRDFFIRFTTIGRWSGAPRTTETTFVWPTRPRGINLLYVSGYPGKRDWVANARAHPFVTIHTVEHGIYYDIPASARVIINRGERTGPLLDFLDRWAKRPEGTQRLFGWFIAAIRINRRCRLPWWGPFYFARHVMDRMPCLELTFAGPPVRRPGPPPSPTSGQ